MSSIFKSKENYTNHKLSMHTPDYSFYLFFIENIPLFLQDNRW